MCYYAQNTWWRHQMDTFSALLAICAENSPVPGEFPTQRPVTRSFDVNFDLRPNKRLSKQSWGWWFEMPSRPLCRHSNECAHPCLYHAMFFFYSVRVPPVIITQCGLIVVDHSLRRPQQAFMIAVNTSSWSQQIPLSAIYIRYWMEYADSLFLVFVILTIFIFNCVSHAQWKH